MEAKVTIVLSHLILDTEDRDHDKPFRRRIGWRLHGQDMSPFNRCTLPPALVQDPFWRCNTTTKAAAKEAKPKHMPIYAHPTLSETVTEAAELFHGQATHLHWPNIRPYPQLHP